MTKSNLIHLYVFNRLADWEIGLAVAHLNSFDGQILPSRYTVRVVGVDLTPITTMGGLRIEPDTTLDESAPEASALLILPGGLGWDAGAHQEALESAKAFVEAGVPVAAICGATMGLARAGLLDSRRHTSNAREYLLASGYAGSALYDDALAVSDQNVITANSVGAVPFAVEIFRMLELYPAHVLAAWQGLFETGEARYFGELMTVPMSRSSHGFASSTALTSGCRNPSLPR
jgi:putative intracellular protease/amidase